MTLDLDELQRLCDAANYANEALFREALPELIAEIRRLRRVTSNLLCVHCGFLCGVDDNDARANHWRHCDTGPARVVLDKLRAELDDERYHHAACLSLAEGAPGWNEFRPKYPAAAAVQKLHAENESLKQELARLVLATGGEP